MSEESGYNDQWFFSAVDVIEVLTESNTSRNYWSMLKKRELDTGIELSTNCVQLKLLSSECNVVPKDLQSGILTFGVLKCCLMFLSPIGMLLKKGLVLNH